MINLLIAAVIAWQGAIPGYNPDHKGRIVLIDKKVVIEIQDEDSMGTPRWTDANSYDRDDLLKQAVKDLYYRTSGDWVPVSTGMYFQTGTLTPTNTPIVTDTVKK